MPLNAPPWLRTYADPRMQDFRKNFEERLASQAYPNKDNVPYHNIDVTLLDLFFYILYNYCFILNL